jgi:dTDP-4-amino-4,6-dideoxygalactose transaminase
MFFRLPPAGNSAITKFEKLPNNYLDRIFHSYTVNYYGSGAEALAAAIKAIINLRNIDAPEVILPAYSCPEVVSAIIYAQARPVLVDLEPDSLQMDRRKIKFKITSNTIAIIAINLFGIQVNINSIRNIIDNNKIIIIEDSAQYFPSSHNHNNWQGDIVILSFGRGKPVSLLGGGVILTKNIQLQKTLKYEAGIPKVKKSGSHIRLLVKLKLYNLFLSPYLFWLPSSLPFLSLGETIFKPLKTISKIDSDIVNLLPSNINKYQLLTLDIQKQIHNKLNNINNAKIIDLPEKYFGSNIPQLIRYPILIKDAVIRDHLYDCLSKKGLGVTKMYQSILPSIPGLEELLKDQGEFPNATNFANTLLTFPSHNGVKLRHVTLLGEILSKYMSEG